MCIAMCIRLGCQGGCVHSYGCTLGVSRCVCAELWMCAGGVEVCVHSYGCTLGVMRWVCA